MNNKGMSEATRALLEPVAELIALGLSQRAIAGRLGVPESKVKGVCERWLAQEWEARPVRQINGRVRVERPPPKPRGPNLGTILKQLHVPRAKTCQWPSEPWRRPWAFCDVPLQDGASRPYCTAHARAA